MTVVNEKWSQVMKEHPEIQTEGSALLSAFEKLIRAVAACGIAEKDAVKWVDNLEVIDSHGHGAVMDFIAALQVYQATAAVMSAEYKGNANGGEKCGS